MSKSGTLLIGLVLATSAADVAHGQNDAKTKVGKMKTYDGRWWETLNQERQEQVIDGFLDGSRSHGAVLDHIVVRSEELTSLYRRNPELLSRPLQASLISGGAPSRQTVPGGEHYTSKHGFFDGDYWFQTSPEGRIGFVEGYLLATSATRLELLNHATAYAASITRWYGFDQADPQPATHAASTPIGDVLERVVAHAK